MSDNDIIEIRPKSVGIMVQAGVAVCDGGRFRSHAATHAFDPLKGQLFESLKAAASAALGRVADGSMRGRYQSIDADQK